jgi:prevent-host-death family protein
MLRGLFRWRRHTTPRDATLGDATAGDATPRRLLIEYTTRDARDRLSLLLRQVRRGEEIVITHGGYPVAKLIPFDGDLRERVPGVIRARIVAGDVRSVRERRRRRF